MRNLFCVTALRQILHPIDPPMVGFLSIPFLSYCYFCSPQDMSHKEFTSPSYLTATSVPAHTGPQGISTNGLFAVRITYSSLHNPTPRAVCVHLIDEGLQSQLPTSHTPDCGLQLAFLWLQFTSSHAHARARAHTHTHTHTFASARAYVLTLPPLSPSPSISPPLGL
jgi:hypothetical protein